MEQVITLAHGAGGKQTSDLIGNLFSKYFDNPDLTCDDAAVLPRPNSQIAISTDGFIVSPAFFKGGNIGKLSICGTVNDLACMGAKPRYISCGFIIEEGFEIAKLEKIAASMAEVANEVGVRIVSGDTKVVGKGQADGIFITTTGVGEVMEGVCVGGALAQAGDAIIVTGDIGRHGCTILLARDEFGIDTNVDSDCAALFGAVADMLHATKNVHVIRDATRGGVGTVLYEIAHQSHVGIRLVTKDIPVSKEVSGVCGMLGLDPMYLACEGRLVIFAPQDAAQTILEALRKNTYTQGAQIIGEVSDDLPGYVTMATELGTEALLPQPTGELLPRIC